ncbi:MAG: ABC transporter substrate-binding protein [Ilumatobacter sp.]
MFDGYGDELLIGEGGLGRVYRATRTSTGGTVAIKTLRDVEDSSPAWHRANRELEAMLRVKGHPYVVTVEEIFRGPEGPCLVMEYLDGGAISDRMSGEPLAGPDVVLIGQHVSQALIAAHEVGIVHRDIKPANLMVGGFGQVKVGDFGISALARGDDQTKTASLTLAYASPEELDGNQRVGAPADVFSLAATMHHLLSGVRPTFSSRVHGWPPLDSSDPAMVPVINAIEAGLTESIEQRPSMEDMSGAFDRSATLLGDRAIKRLATAVRADDSVTVARSTGSALSSSEPVVAESSPQRPIGLIVAAVAGLVALAVGALVVLGGRGDDESDAGATTVAEAPLDSSASTPTPAQSETPPASTPASDSPADTVLPASSPPTTLAPLVADGTLTIAGLFPSSGDMAEVAIAPNTGAQLAVDDINAAGGVLGQPVELSIVSSIDPDPTGADVVLGPLTSDDEAIDTARAAGSLVITPAVPDDRFTGDGFVRLVASNSMQARAIVTQMIDDGVQSVGIVGIADGAPRTITDAAADAASAAGLDVVHERGYDPGDEDDLASIAQELLDDGPDAVLIAGFEEDTAAVISAIAAGNDGSVPFALYGTAANTGGGLVDLVGSPEVVSGMVGTFLAAPADAEFLTRLGDLSDPTYGAESYDAVILVALAAVADDSDAPASLADQIVDVSRSGIECTEFAECAALLDAGEDIDYQGRSGAVDLTDDFELATASVLVFRYDTAGEFQFERMIGQA